MLQSFVDSSTVPIGTSLHWLAVGARSPNPKLFEYFVDNDAVLPVPAVVQLPNVAAPVAVTDAQVPVVNVATENADVPEPAVVKLPAVDDAQIPAIVAAENIDVTMPTGVQAEVPLTPSRRRRRRAASATASAPALPVLASFVPQVPGAIPGTPKVNAEDL